MISSVLIFGLSFTFALEFEISLGLWLGLGLGSGLGLDWGKESVDLLHGMILLPRVPVSQPLHEP